MGCCTSSPLEAEITSLDQNDSKTLEMHIRDLERQLQEAKAKLPPPKVLLLGSGDSGKTTVLKQLQFLYKTSLSLQDTESYRLLIFDNVTWGMSYLIKSMKDMGSTVLVENIPHGQLLAGHPLLHLRDGEPFPEHYHQPLRSLWEDPNVRNTWELANDVVIENLPYFLSSLDRLFHPTYTPTEQDILRCRVTTTGCHETRFKMESKDREILVVDVGGQRSERKKWINCVREVSSVLFFVSLSGYDQHLVEDRSVNQMEEDMALWGSICKSKWFKEASIILFLNKNDLFERKVSVSDIKHSFPDYTGESGDVCAGRYYFRRRFAEIAQEAGRSGKRTVVIHTITATDTALVHAVMTSIEE